MWSTSKRSLVVVRALTLMVLCGLPGGLRAQGKAEIDRDVQELRQYRLTIEKVRQMTVATLSYAQAMDRNPKAQARRQRENEIAALEAKGVNRLSATERQRLEELRLRERIEDADAARQGDNGEPRTLAEMSRRIEREPDLAAAIRGAGLTTREFSLITLSFYQAMFAHGMRKAGTISEIPKDILPENVAFITSHEAELNQLLAQLQAYERR